MISLFIVVIFIIAAAFFLIAKRDQLVTGTTRYDEKIYNGPLIAKGVAIVVFGLLVALFQPFVLTRVDAGHVGIKVNLTGNERGVSDYKYKTGWVIYNSWTENLYEFPTFQQHIEYDDQTVITKGGFSAKIKPTFNYALKAETVGDMFVNLRVDIKALEQGWLKTAIVGSVVDIANKWTVDDIFNRREEFEQSIIIECNKRVEKWFTISQLRTNITPPPALQSAIEQKTQAVQLAQAELQKVTVANAQAEVKIAQAKGDSAQAVIRASGQANAALITAQAEAKAIKLKQQEVSMAYIEYIKAQTWDGKLPVTVLGNSTPMINIK